METEMRCEPLVCPDASGGSLVNRAGKTGVNILLAAGFHATGS